MTSPELLRAWGINVRSLRQARGWTLDRLASEVGVTPPTVCRWERGQVCPRDDHKQRVAEVLEADVRLLFPLVRRSA